MTSLVGESSVSVRYPATIGCLCYPPAPTICWEAVRSGFSDRVRTTDGTYRLDANGRNMVRLKANVPMMRAIERRLCQQAEDSESAESFALVPLHEYTDRENGSLLYSTQANLPGEAFRRSPQPYMPLCGGISRRKSSLTGPPKLPLQPSCSKEPLAPTLIGPRFTIRAGFTDISESENGRRHPVFLQSKQQPNEMTRYPLC